MKLTWEYIAGFFDGEGCVSTHANRARRGSFGTHVSMSQSQERGRLLLLEIQAFLAGYGIKSYLLRINKRAALPQWNLTLAARPSVTVFLQHMLGRVAIKRIVVEDTLRFLRLFPSTRGPVTSSRNREGCEHVTRELIQTERAEGLTLQAIADKHGVSRSTIKKRKRQAAA